MTQCTVYRPGALVNVNARFADRVDLQLYKLWQNKTSVFDPLSTLMYCVVQTLGLLTGLLLKVSHCLTVAAALEFYKKNVEDDVVR